MCFGPIIPIWWRFRDKQKHTAIFLTSGTLFLHCLIIKHSWSVGGLSLLPNGNVRVFTILKTFIMTRGYSLPWMLRQEHTSCWPSEAFVKTLTRSGTNTFGVFSCVGSFRSCTDIVCSDSTCEVWGCWPSVGFSDWRCTSESARCVGGEEYCVLCFSMHSILSFLVFMFWSTGTRLAGMSV